jgi:hypothetical protein
MAGLPFPQNPEDGRYIDPISMVGEIESIDDVEEVSLGDLFSEEGQDEIEELEDGSALVHLTTLKGPDDNPDFYENLAEKMPDGELMMLAIKFLGLLDKDKQARQKRDEQYEEGIRRSGLGNDAPGGAQFQGASRTVHPVMAESGVDFAARAMKELFPPDGPVKSKIIGEANEDKQRKANNKRDFMNWQCTEQIIEFRDEEEQMTTQLPFGGSQYLKMWFDPEMRRPRIEFVPIDNIYLPYASVNFYTASRMTEVDDIIQDTFDQRVASGLYRDINTYTSSMEPELSKAAKANMKVEGKTDTGENPDGIRRTFNIYTWLKTDYDKVSKGKRAPYILMIDEQSRQVVGLYRNWEDGDDRCAKLDHIIEFKFIPWRGAYAIGLPHLIGGLSAALTGALRALLDSAHINTAATMLKLKGAKISGQSQNIEVTQVTEIEGAPGVDDIRKIAMPMPFNPPSPVLFSLLGWLTDAAKGVVTTAEEKIADISSTAPVGTTQAMIEQGAAVFSAIHARLHASQARLLKVLARINRWHFDDMDLDDIVEEIPVTKDDFIKMSDVVPVSDPNIFSDTQRYAQAQALAQRVQANPQLYNQLAVEKRILQTMKIPNIQDVLPDPSKVEDMNPALENVSMTLGKPVGAFPSQDHLAHIQTHLDFATNPVLGGSPIMNMAFLPPVINHIKEHLSFWYLDQMNKSTQVDMLLVQKTSIADQSKIASASVNLKTSSQQQLADLMKDLVSLQQVVQQMQQDQKQQQIPMDPNAKALVDAQMAETQRKAAQDKVKAQMDAQKAQADAAAENQKLMSDQQMEAARLQTQVAISSASNVSQERIKGMQIELDTAKLDAERQRIMVEEEQMLHNMLNPQPEPKEKK